MNDEQRKAIALDYIYALDHGTTQDGRKIIDLFAEDAQLYFPKWGVAQGHEEIQLLLSDISKPIQHIEHHVEDITWILSGSDLLVAEGTSHGQHVDGPWRAGSPDWGSGRWCDVFEIRENKIQRVFIYLDPDYAGLDKDRYAWLHKR